MTKKKQAPASESQAAETKAIEVAAVDVAAEDKELSELTSLLEGYSSASPKTMKLVLAKARRLQKCSQVVQLAAILLKADQFNMDECAESAASPGEPQAVFSEGDSVYDQK